MASSLRYSALTLLAIIAVNCVSAEITPDPIPRVYPHQNLVDRTLSNLAFGPNNQIQKRIAALENYISSLVNKGEKLLNKLLDQVEANVIRLAATNGITKVEATITYVDGQVSQFEAAVDKLVNLLIQKVRTSVTALAEKIKTETQASLASGVVRSAISRIETLIEQTISSLRALLNRTKQWVEAIIHAAESKSRGSHSNAEVNQLIQQAKGLIDNSILITENQVNRRIWNAYKRVHSESQPLTALLHSLL